MRDARGCPAPAATAEAARPGARGRTRRVWAILKVPVGLGMAGLALWALGGHTGELSGLGGVLAHLGWSWMAPAVALEAASLVAFAGLQARLLAAGGVRAPRRPLLSVTLGSQAITSSLPGGTALATVYGFRWYRRFGADDALAGWTLAGTMVGAIVSLALVAAAGVVLSTDQGASLGLIPVVAGVLFVALFLGALFYDERPLTWLASWALRTAKKLTGRPRGDLSWAIEAIVQRLTVVRLDWRGATSAVAWGLASWLADGACFALSFLAIGSGIPWKGLLLAYGAGQLAANLPITPGGLGAVEGSITVALVAFGGSRTATVDAVLVYRLVSFWLVLAVGWLAAGKLALGVRRGRWAVLTPGVPLGILAPVAAPPTADPAVDATGDLAAPPTADPAVDATGDLAAPPTGNLAVDATGDLAVDATGAAGLPWAVGKPREPRPSALESPP